MIVTRPAKQQDELSKAIRDSGGEALSLPLLAIESITGAGAKTRLAQGLACLPDCDTLIFVSTNAARFGAQFIEQGIAPKATQGAAKSNVAISPRAALFAVGAATAREAERFFHRPVQAPADGSGSEHLLRLAELREVQGRRIAIFRGEGGRELLANELRRRGARVDYLEVYRRVPAPGAAEALREILRRGPPGLAVITSAEALARWRELLDEMAETAQNHPIALPLRASEGAHNPAGQSPLDSLLQVPVAVPSKRVAELAAQLGFAAVIDTVDAGAKTIVAALAAYLRQRQP